MKKKIAKKPNDNEALLERYKTAKAEAADLEGEISLMRDQIISHIGSGEHGAYIVLIQDQERESFALKAARAELPDNVISRVINPFINVTEFKTVRVERKDELH